MRKSPRRAAASQMASRIVVARIGEAPLVGRDHMMGYVCRSFMAEEIHILRLVVDPAHRRRGIGRRLLDAVIDESRDVRAAAIFLEVGEKNEAARCLYRAAGFSPIGTRRDYYGRGNHAVAMVLRPGDDGR